MAEETGRRWVVQLLLLTVILFSFGEFFFMIFGVYGLLLVDPSNYISIIMLLIQLVALLLFLGLYGTALYRISTRDGYFRIFFAQQTLFPSGHIVIFLIFIAKVIYSLLRYPNSAEVRKRLEEGQREDFNAANYPVSDGVIIAGFVGYLLFFVYSIVAHLVISNEYLKRKQTFHSKPDIHQNYK